MRGVSKSCRSRRGDNEPSEAGEKLEDKGEQGSMKPSGGRQSNRSHTHPIRHLWHVDKRLSQLTDRGSSEGTSEDAQGQASTG